MCSPYIHSATRPSPGVLTVTVAVAFAMAEGEQQAAFVEGLPEVFLPIAGGWGRMGMTHIRLAEASEDVLEGALRTAWKLRVEKNAKSGKKSSAKKWRVTSGEKRKTKKKKR